MVSGCLTRVFLVGLSGLCRALERGYAEACLGC